MQRSSRGAVGSAGSHLGTRCCRRVFILTRSGLQEKRRSPIRSSFAGLLGWKLFSFLCLCLDSPNQGWIWEHIAEPPERAALRVL